MIVTLTLNPAIDRTIKVDQINQRDVTRVTKTIRDAAGKGINVSKVIHSLGGNTIAAGFLAGENGAFIKKALSALNISYNFVEVEGNTRENIKIQETNKNNVIEINESGPTITKEETNRLNNTLDKLLQPGDILVMSGSIPKGIENDYYKKLIEKHRQNNVKTILDTSLELLTIGLEGKPHIIKPNLYELEKLVGKELKTTTEIIQEARQICKQGIHQVIVSLGSEGVLYVDLDQVLKVTVPKVEVESTVGAGDSFVAGLSYSLDNNYSLENTLMYSASVATASCMTEGTNPGSKEDINEIYKKVKIEEV